MVIGRRALLRLGGAALAWRFLGGAECTAADPLGETFAELEQRAREYQASLERLVALHEAALAHATAAAERSRRLHADGLIARQEVDGAEHAVVEARGRLGDARRQLTEAADIMAEAHALRRLAELPPVAPGKELAAPQVLQYHGASPWTLTQIASLDQFFAARFGRPLPVSALGQTELHDRLGFDHRNAADIAVHPDSPEGKALLDHLRARGIPFLAFRGPVPGASTGAHVHVGTPSPRTG